MIRYTLRCDRDHSFDSWFQSADAFDKLSGAEMVACAVCGSTAVEKAPMAPQVRTARASGGAADANTDTETDTGAVEPRPLSSPASPAEQALAELRRRIEAGSDDVGRNFAREARRIHAGEAPERAIRGEARPDEARALIEDGIPVTPLPWPSQRKTN